MSLLTITGEFEAPELDGADINSLLESMKATLVREGAVGAHRAGSSISFRGSWVGPTIRVLYAQGRSAIEVIPGNPTRVRYQFSQTPSVVVLAVLVVLLVGAASLQLGRFDVGVFLFFVISIGVVALFAARIGPERIRYFVRRVIGLPLT